EDVLLGDAPAAPGAGNLLQLLKRQAVLGSDIGDDRRNARLPLARLVTALPVTSRCFLRLSAGRFRLGARGRLNGLRTWWGGNLLARLADVGQQRPGGDGLAGLHVDRQQRPARRGGDLRVDLVALDFKQRLV